MGLQKSFSLVELMVVIAIIGILSAIAVPNYRSYIIKSQIVEALVILRALEKIGTVQYQTTGTIPSSIQFGGLTLAAGANVAYSTKYVNYIHYNNDANSQWYCVLVYNVSIPGIVPATAPGNWGINTSICSHTSDNNGIIKSVCGMWQSSDTRMIPSQYLPSGCNCTNVSNVASPSCP